MTSTGNKVLARLTICVRPTQRKAGLQWQRCVGQMFYLPGFTAAKTAQHDPVAHKPGAQLAGPTGGRTVDARKQRVLGTAVRMA